jgi:hypothetical protein
MEEKNFSFLDLVRERQIDVAGGRVYRMLIVITVCSTTAIRNGRVHIGLPSTKINTTAGRTDPRRNKKEEQA